MASIAESDREYVAECLGRAIRHAERVCKREHIKADRIERVNQFIVSLRSQLISVATIRPGEHVLVHWAGGNPLNSKDYVSLLCKKEVWFDIGHPQVGMEQTNRIASSEITKLLALSKTFSHHTDVQAEEILGDLEEVERGINGLLVHVEDATRINDDGATILHDLCAVFSDD
jgi:hypothetical protein